MTRPCWLRRAVRNRIATPSSRRRVDGVEDDATIQHERAVKFDFHTGGYPMTTTSYAAFYPAFFPPLQRRRLYGLICKHIRTRSRSSSDNSREYNTELKPFVNKNTGDI